MARPITWRNVNSASNAPAAAMLDSAGQSINQGFEGFRNLLNEAQQVRTDNHNQQIENNNQEVAGFLQGITDPEEMERVRKSGEFRKMLEGYGAMVDQEKFQGAGQERLNALRQQETADWNYQTAQQERADKPFLEQANRTLSNISLDTDAGEAQNQIDAFRQQLVESGASDRVLSQFNTQANQRLQGIEDEFQQDYQFGRQVAEDKRTDKKRKLNERMDEIINQTYTPAMENMDAGVNLAKQEVESLAKTMGVPVKQLQDEEFRRNLTPDQRALFKQTRQRIVENMPQNVAPGALREQAVQQLTDAGVPYLEAVTRVNEADQRFADTQGLSTTARQKVTKAETDYQTQMKSNSFYQAENSGETLSDILGELSKEARKRWEDNGTELNNFVSDALSGEYDIGGEKIALPKGVIQAVIQTTEPDQFGVWDGVPSEVVEDVLQGSKWAEELEAYNKAKSGLRDTKNRIRLTDNGGVAPMGTYEDILNLPDPATESEPTPKPTPDQRQKGAQGSWETSINSLRDAPLDQQRERGVAAEGTSKANLEKLQKLGDQMRNADSFDEKEKLTEKMVKLLSDTALVNGSGLLDVDSRTNLPIVLKELQRRGIR